MISEKEESLDIHTDGELTEEKEIDRGTWRTTSIYRQVDNALSSNDNEQLRKLARLSALERSRCHFLKIPSEKTTLPPVSEFWKSPSKSRSRSRTRSPNGRYALARQWFFWSPFSEEDVEEINERYSLNEYLCLFSEQDRRSLRIAHPDEHQVRLDIDRSFIHYPRNITSKQKDQLKALLHDLIISTLRLRPSLHYFQGFHDIIGVLVVELDLDLLRMQKFVEKFALHWCRDGMGVGLEPILGWLRLIQKILIAVDLDLAVIVERTSPEPFFALSWILTLFAHDVTSQAGIARLFDVWIAEGPHALVYFCVALILHKKEQIMGVVKSEDFDDDIGNLHAILSSIPDSLDKELPLLLDSMMEIKRTYPLNHPFVDVDVIMGSFSVLRSPPISISDEAAEFATRKVGNLVKQPLPALEILASAIVKRNQDQKLQLMRRNRVKWAITVSVTVSAIVFGYYTKRKPDVLGLLKSTLNTL
ncbi:hypothetical protein E3Q23_04181 [Wallemia mellicola]|uniref:Rab-GAP TBC domain-containing protein n=1 Tax=Wallemia mellicola TaxID=1708541 RepID=A0A4T0LLF0_9BASI|nr:hypothetical protein E3Q23_04181 [Wallemia mellicola]TIB79336.1 hypothetical protein E3Q21_04173 [Wallemia mellicola]TIB83464.1 hypothetical protein E3Q20_04144 [Wallemia mellicola]TIB99428.1 hypothetical protein E3Q16_04183 [Wallemia mellicola]TIC36900.1 hypothetical protein E3Q08_04181 [Wallemia mellicola]